MVSQDAPAAAPSMNSHAIGYAGLIGGGTGLATIVAAIVTLFRSLADPQFILSLWTEHATKTFGPAHATLVACGFGILGACVVTGIAVVAAYVGKPRGVA